MSRAREMFRAVRGVSWPVRVRVPAAGSGVVALLRLMPRVGRGRSVLLVAGILLSAASPVAVAVTTGLLIGSLADTARDGFGSSSGTLTVTLLVVAGALLILLGAAVPVMHATASMIGRALDRYLQELVFKAVCRPVGIGHLEDRDVLDEVRLVRGLGLDAQRPSRAIEALPVVLPAWLQGLGSAAVLVAFHWWLGLVWLLVWPFMVYRLEAEYVRVGRMQYGASTALRQAEYLRDLALTAPAAKELRVWGMLDWLVARFDGVWRAAAAPVFVARKPRLAVVFGTSGALLVINGATYALLIWAAVRGDLGLGAFAVFVQASAGANAFDVEEDYAHLAFAAVVVPKVLDLGMRLAPGPEAIRASAEGLLASEGSLQTAIRFEAVTFGYPGSDKVALSGLDLVIPAGRSLAIVGENGAGKTSLVKLLCRLYDPNEGRITADGTDLTDIDERHWRARVAVLFQDFARYHLPIRDNIALGAPEHRYNEDRLDEAARSAGILEMIESLPHGWDTVLSREYTRGADLSGGQWQRVALARALFAVQTGAGILVLDEPTAALDVRAEAALYERFLEHTQGLTTCIISHRFSTVRRADHIVVLAGGKVIEQGNHDELMAVGGQYAYMFGLQAQRFRDEVMD